MKKIVVATNNEGKLKEIKAILKNYKLLSLKDMDCDIEVIEDKESFKGNARKKAKEISDFLKLPCIADDSGLCIDIYNGWPGIHTSRFLGNNTTARERNKYIINKMKSLSGKDRQAQIKCYISYYDNGIFIDGIGEIKGRISQEIRGDNGFGFDEIFELQDGRTLAELTELEKNSVSARMLALQDLMYKLENSDCN